ncbi:MAG: hypothetical protein DWQ01_09085 [Planctomycetota bacterium]|nr:MAG: hypothetical protein DWQ01_09085 [Planctomycetota bacterium]
MGWSYRFRADPPIPMREHWPDGKPLTRWVDRPTVQVDLWQLPDDRQAVLKRYVHPHWHRRLLAAHRHGWLGPSKPESEARNLLALSAHGVITVGVLAWSTLRGLLGDVQDGWILTAFQPGETLETLLNRNSRLSPAAWRVLGASLAQIHAAGCWYRKPFARNLLWTPEEQWCWLDAQEARWPKSLASWQRSWDQACLCLPWQGRLDDQAWSAFQSGYGEGQIASKLQDLAPSLPGRWKVKLEQRLERERLRQEASLNSNP